MMVDGRHLEKSQYLCNRLADFDKIWHGDVSPPYEPFSQ